MQFNSYKAGMSAGVDDAPDSSKVRSSLASKAPQVLLVSRVTVMLKVVLVLLVLEVLQVLLVPRVIMLNKLCGAVSDKAGMRAGGDQGSARPVGSAGF